MNKLELMENIYAITKIKPKLWYDLTTDTFGKEKKTLMIAKLLNNNEEFKYNLEFPCPYYPMEQVLDYLGRGVYKEIGNSQECKHLTALRIWYYALGGNTNE